MSLRDFKTIKERREFISGKLNLRFKAVGSFPSDLEGAQFTNCENMIGATAIPLGIAGPLMIKGEFTRREYYMPLATTEGALVASVNRGCKAINQSNGVTVAVENVGATRGPVFHTSGLTESLKLRKWMKEHLDELNSEASKTSGHIKLRKIGSRVIGRNVYIRFYFDTNEAMGMNMVTIATARIAKFIENKTAARCVAVAGNFDTDKKPSWLNMISGRGKRVWAEVVLPHEVLAQTLKTTAQKMHEVWLSKCMLGSAMSGSMGFNSHFANVVAAFFMATGQDVAHTVEGSLGFTTTELDKGGLYVSVYLPDLMVGTVGGGTKLPSQKEALSILGIKADKNSSYKLAEIVAAAVLAGEISLLASISEGSLASAHASLARRK